MLTADLQKYGLQELQFHETLLYNGGGTEWTMPKWMKALSPIAVIGLLNESWPEIKREFVNGWNLQ